MVNGSTALSYQMMYEDKLNQAAINCATQGDYMTGAEYLKATALFLGLDISNISQPPLETGSLAGQSKARKYYFDILHAIAKQGNENLIKVRKQYRGDLPS